MSKKPVGWREWLGLSKPVDRFSLEELERLHNELVRQIRIHKAKRGRLDSADPRASNVSLHGNKETFIETLRSIAELMIWGDQHEPRFFDFFLEKNVLYEFYEILSSPENRRGEIATQVLQTLSIMILNIKRDTSIFYLFSNNHLNNILQLDFDFTDEEVLAFYISFLKSISLKLNPRTIHFFFQKSEDGVSASFPLYTEAIRFVGNKEAMVRAAVRTLTLNVYSVDDPDLQEFIVSKPASNYFTELALHATEQCQVLDRLLLEAENTIADSYGALDSQLNRIEDMLSYFNDIFLTGADLLRARLASCLWEHFVGPALLWPLLEVGSGPWHSPSFGISRTGVFRAVSSLYVIERLFHILESSFLCEAIACCLLAGDGCFLEACERATTQKCTLKPTAPFHSFTVPDLSDEASSISTGDVEGRHPPSSQRSSREASSLMGLFIKYRESFLRCLSGDSTQIGTAAVRVLVSLMLHPSLDPDVLDVCGVLPVRSRIRRNLLNELAGPDELDRSVTRSLPVRPSSQNSSQSQEDNAAPTNTTRRRTANPMRLFRSMNQRNNSKKELDPSPTAVEDKEATEEDDSPHSPSSSKISKSEELMKALIQLTLLPTLPPLTICYISWIIMQLTKPSDLRRPSQSEGDAPWHVSMISDDCIDSVSTALVVCQTSVADELRGLWVDALVYLTQQEWPRSLHNIMEPRLICTSTSLLDSIFAQKASELGSALYNAHGSVTSQQLAVRLRLELSAQCALHVFFKLRRLIALTQLKQYLLHGKIAETSGLPIVSLEQAQNKELKEGMTIGLASTPIIPCTVAFRRGQEMAAYYCVQGLPERAMMNESPSHEDEMMHVTDVAQSSPFVVLAAPIPSRLNMGSVLSAAPLLGTEPKIDPQHENWLHLRIRPSIASFMEACSKAAVWNEPPWTSFRGRFCDGHWVLAFHNPGEALRAKYMTQEFIAKLSALNCNVLSPLLTNDSPSCNGHLT